jgi:hypothetical protein
MSHTTRSQWIARVEACLLWLAGSALLIRTEMSVSSPDWVVIATVPLVWAVVISLPILAHHALQDRHWLAASLLALAAVVGSTYTLSGTITRQSESRDVKVASAEATNFRLDEKKADLSRSQQRYRDAMDAADRERGTTCGPRCQDWERRAREVKALIDRTTEEIAALGPEAPVASGEMRLAAFVALFPGVAATADEIEPYVAMFSPSLLGISVELAALALGFYGWRPVPISAPPRSSATISISETVADPQREAVIQALRRSSRPLTNDELAEAMGVSKAEASKRVASLNGHVRKTRSGREVQIALVN